MGNHGSAVLSSTLKTSIQASTSAPSSMSISSNDKVLKTATPSQLFHTSSLVPTASCDPDWKQHEMNRLLGPSYITPPSPETFLISAELPLCQHYLSVLFRVLQPSLSISLLVLPVVLPTITIRIRSTSLGETRIYMSIPQKRWPEKAV